MGLALSATFFVGSPFTEPAPAVETAEGIQRQGQQPAVPAITPSPNDRSRPDAARSPEEREERRPAIEVPRDKTLRVTVPAMSRVENSTIPYTDGTDEEAFKQNAGVHLRGTGFPWQRVANVYIAGHRLGYVGTPSWLGFWDLDNLNVGDEIYVTDAMDRRYVYRVFKEFVVDPRDVYVTEPIKGKNVLTLQTCTLPDYSRRLIVQAERVEGPAASTPGEDGA